MAFSSRRGVYGCLVSMDIEPQNPDSVKPRRTFKRQFSLQINKKLPCRDAGRAESCFFGFPFTQRCVPDAFAPFGPSRRRTIIDRAPSCLFDGFISKNEADVKNRHKKPQNLHKKRSPQVIRGDRSPSTPGNRGLSPDSGAVAQTAVPSAQGDASFRLSGRMTRPDRAPTSLRGTSICHQ